jgi:ATP phosphoribosyltransferase
MDGMMDNLRLLIPKGRIYDNVARLFEDAGYRLGLSERTYRPVIEGSGFEAKIMKPQNVGELLALNRHDAGFTGLDWIEEKGVDLVKVLDLGMDRVRIVAAAPVGVDDAGLRERELVAATEYVEIARRWLERGGYRWRRIIRTYGATEVFPPDDADLIIDNTASGQTLRDNGLRIVAEIMESSTWFVASPEAMENREKRERIEELKMLFEAVLTGRRYVMLEMNVDKGRYDGLAAFLESEGMRSPTVSPLFGDKGYAVKIASRKDRVPALVPQLKKHGAADILEYNLAKVVR